MFEARGCASINFAGTFMIDAHFCSASLVSRDLRGDFSGLYSGFVDGVPLTEDLFLSGYVVSPVARYQFCSVEIDTKIHRSRPFIFNVYGNLWKFMNVRYGILFNVEGFNYLVC